ncbi:MAG: helix-turn-helix transcriptional regulator [Chloroflexi bacterium]|nr:helix-turn-helix transcriptional regulator [Chloroflexota bacterium]
MVKSAAPADRLSLVFAALADPTRRAILARLADGQVTVTELAAPFAMSLPAVSKHLSVLERAGLIVRGRAAQWRPCRLQPAPFREVASWLDAYRDLWDERLDRLDTYLTAIQQQEQPDAQPPVDPE